MPPTSSHSPAPHARRLPAGRGALISLHDVTPAHEDRVFEAIAHLRRLGVDALGLLVVPDFHHRAHLGRAAAFCKRLRGVMTDRDEILLHGFWHLADTQARDPGRRLLAGALTAGEGEFHALGYAEARERLHDGLEVLEQALDARPTGFVAPAWLQNAEVRRACRDAGLRYCEDHLRVYDLAADTSVLAPALSFASRTRTRLWGSLASAEVTARVLPLQPVVRLAVHPADYRHRRLVDAIGRVVRRWLPTHRPLSYREAMPCTSAS